MSPLITVLLAGLSTQPSQEKLHLPAIFSDGLVLQRNIPIPIFGTAKPGNRVVVEMGTERLSTYAEKDGRWMVKLSPHGAGGPYIIWVKTAATQIRLQDVQVGEVWLASG